jgi:hypothetical protein
MNADSRLVARLIPQPAAGAQDPSSTRIEAEGRGIKMDEAATLSEPTRSLAARGAGRTMRIDVDRVASEWAASLIGWVQLLPGLIAGWAVVMYVQQDAAIRHLALPVGLAGGIASWLLLGLAAIRFAGPERSNRTVYDDVIRRAKVLERQLPQLQAKNRALFETAKAAYEHIERTLGLAAGTSAAAGSQWVQATGYVDLWAAIHTAEEALLAAGRDEELLTIAFTDRARLRASRIDARDDLLLLSGQAIITLNESAAANLPMPKPSSFDGPSRTRLAKTVVQEVRHAINAYRHDRAAGLVRLKRQLVHTTTLTGLFAVLGVALAIVVGVVPEVVGGAAAFWVVGALTGLFQSAYTQQRSQYAVEDYGLATARMFLAPYLAGIAAVFGVFAVAFVAGAPLGVSLLAPQGGDAAALRSIFDVTAHPVGLVVAAVFGLTPELIISRLRSIGEQLKLDIQSTEATTVQGGTATP